MRFIRNVGLVATAARSRPATTVTTITATTAAAALEKFFRPKTEDGRQFILSKNCLAA
jgi:hypothetical protein